MTGEHNEATAERGSSGFQEGLGAAGGREEAHPGAWERQDGEDLLRLCDRRDAQAWGVGVTLELAACGTRHHLSTA